MPSGDQNRSLPRIDGNHYDQSHVLSGGEVKRYQAKGYFGKVNPVDQIGITFFFRGKAAL